MLTYTFDSDSKIPVYEQLYTFIKKDIHKHNLVSMDKLPSKRALANHLGISTITVEGAYGLLISEGYIYSLPQRGYFVSDISDIPFLDESDHNNPDTASNNLNSDSNNINTTTVLADEDTSSNEESSFSESFNIYDYFSDEDYTNLSDDSMPSKDFPFSTWASIGRSVLSNKQKELLTPSSAKGVLELRNAIARELWEFREIKVSPEQIIVGAGTEYLYGLIVQLIGRDKTYCIENPGYHKIKKIYDKNDVNVILANLDDDGIKITDIQDSNADIVHISPTHQYPTGITMPISRRFQILNWAYENPDRFIIEDDYDSEFRLNGKPIPSLQSIDKQGKVIYINTFSKSLTSTMRISYMVLPERLVKQYEEQLNFYSCTVSNFEQYTLAEFMNKGYFEKHINRMRLKFARNRKVILNAFKDSGILNKCEIIEKEYGLHFIIKLKTEQSDEVIQTKLTAHGIILKRVADHTYIINYSNIDPKKLETALLTLERYIVNS